MPGPNKNFGDINADAVGSETNPSSAELKESSGVVFARNFDGSDLPSKIQNALTWLSNNQSGQGRVRVTPKHDGSDWSWPSELTLDPTAYDGFQIDIDTTAHIDVSISAGEWALIIDSDGNFDGASGAREAQRFATVTGGVWNLSNSTDPAGCFRIQDTGQVHLEPSNIRDCTNSSSDAAAVQVANVDSFCEDNYIGGPSADVVDIGVDFAPASVTGGTGTESYDSCYVDRTLIKQCQNIGIRFRGKVQNTVIEAPTVFPGDDNVVSYSLDGDFTGSEIRAPKVEEAQAVTGTVAFQTGSNYGHSPLISGPDIVSSDTKYSRDTSSHYIAVIGMGSGAGVYEPEGGPSDRFVLADGETIIFALDNDGLILNNREVAMNNGFFMGGGAAKFGGNNLQGIANGANGNESIKFSGGAGFFTNGTNIFFVNESGQEEQITSL